MRRSRRTASAIAFFSPDLLALHTLTALFLFFRFLPRLQTHILADDGFIAPGRSDAFNFLWNYWWTQTAFSLGKNPFFCDWVLPPTGLDLSLDTHLLVPTLITQPISAVFGTIAGYNAMVLSMLVLGAYVYSLFLRRTFGWGRLSTYLGGVFFGFAPYFLFKSHAHINLIGGAFWGGALGIVVYAYVLHRFTWRTGLLFGLFSWMVFWTSLVEFFMTAVCLVLIVAVLEVAGAGRKSPSWPDRLRFAAVPAIGILASLFVYVSQSPGAMQLPVYSSLSLVDLISPYRLSALHGLSNSRIFEFWGVAVPLATWPILGLGLLRGKIPRKGQWAVLGLILIAISLDLGGGPGEIVRRIPMGEGFRVFSRFFPFLLFFAGIVFAAGIERVILARGAKLALLIPLAALWILEIYPWNLNTTRVLGMDFPEFDRGTVDLSRFVLVVTNGGYRPVHDTYQVSMDRPFVLVSSVSPRLGDREAIRMRDFPIVHGRVGPSSPDQLSAELEKLNVGYVLFEGKAAFERWPLKSETVFETGSEVLVRLSR
jgi:hypothetical protein